MNKKGNKMSNKQNFHLPPKGKCIPKYSTIKKEIIGREVVGLEVVKGHSMIISYDSFKKDFDIEYERKKDEKESNSAFIVLDGNINNSDYAFYKNVRTVANIIGGGEVDFALYGEFIDQETQRQPYIKNSGADFLLYDIYVNDNWMCQDDIDIIAEKSNLRLAPKIFNDGFNEIKLNKLTTEKSSYNKKVKCHSIMVKPTLEDEYNNNRIVAIFTNSAFKKDEEKSSEFYKKCEDLAQEVIGKHLTNHIIKEVEKTVRKKYLVINKSNKDKVLSYSINETLSKYLNHNIKTYVNKYFGSSYEFSSVYKTVHSYLKKRLPYFYLKHYNLK